MRLLITGSRNWYDMTTIDREIRRAITGYELGQVVIVHGACPRGADRIADLFARRNRIRVERHPANWGPEGGPIDRRAGFKRNAHMVNRGADICLAFIRDNSPGATHCASLAERAGIPVRRFTL